MQAEIITIGDELLIGQTIDTNSAWMGSKLNEVGVDVRQIRSVADRPEAIVYALDRLLPDTRLVLLTGGLGPTKDDLTKYTLNNYFGGELVFNEEAYANIERIFREIGRDLSKLNRNQALLPSVCEVLINKVGTASGMKFERNGVVYISMPGVPYEMKGLMHEYVFPWVKAQMENFRIHHRTVLTQGVPESVLSNRLEKFEAELPATVKLAYLPSPGLVKLRLTTRGADPDLEKIINAQAAKMKEILGDVIFGENADSLEEIIGHLLVKRGESLSTAESCTGGYIAHRITSIPGSSRYYLGSVIAYDNRLKREQLGVDEELLKKHGAVSEAVVSAMAEGARKNLGSEWALATSGIAGPDGGSPEKPVGTVWIACSGPDGTQAQLFQFGTNRERTIKKTALMAMDILRRRLIS